MMHYTNEHILGLFRKLASEANFINSFVHMTTADRLTHTMKSKINYPILAVEPPVIGLNHSETKDKFIQEGLAKIYHFYWYVFLNSPAEDHRNIDGYLALTDQYSDQLMYWLLNNESEAMETLFDPKIKFNFSQKQAYINYDQDGLVGWQIQTTAKVQFCNPDCLSLNFFDHPHLPYSSFKVESTDGLTVKITDLSQGHNPAHNLINYQYDSDSYKTLESGNVLDLDERELVIWLAVSNDADFYYWSRIHIPNCKKRSFCLISHPSGKCGEIVHL